MSRLPLGLCLGMLLTLSVTAVQGQAEQGAKNPGVIEKTWIEATLAREKECELKIRTALAKRKDFNEVEKPLAQLVEELQKELKINVHLDIKGLEDEAIDSQKLLSLKATDLTYESALNLLLEPELLTYTIRDEALYITTKSKSYDLIEVRVHEVADLVLIDLDDPREGADYQGLIDIITSTVSPDTWDTVGGRGSVREFRAAGIEVLVFAQTRKVHEQTEMLLAKLRQARKGNSRKGPQFNQTNTPNFQNLANADPTKNEPQPPSGPLPKNEDRDALRGPQIQLACNLYQQAAAKKTGNLMISPYSVANALGMLSAGAKGETAKEIAQALHVELPAERLHPAMAALAAQLPLGEFQGQQLRLANRLWAQAGDTPIEPAFLDITKTHYLASITQANFSDDSTRQAINAWTEQQTNGKIRELFAPGSLGHDTRLALVNTLYFRGRWQTPFDKAFTKPLPFHTLGKSVNVPTMWLKDNEAQYARLDGLRLLTKSYGGSLALTVLLPDAETEFATFERSLTAENLTQWLAAPRHSPVEISLPKFKFETDLELKPLLASLGVKLAFQIDQADLSGIQADGQLYLDAWKHKTVIELDETGTVAAAATGGGAFGGAFGPNKTPSFRADRPFIFLIHDLRTGTLLFLGRVVDPSVS